MSILILLAGTDLIKTFLNKQEYLIYIRDERRKESVWRKIWVWGLYLVTIVMVIIIVYVGMNLWKALFLSQVN